MFFPALLSLLVR